MTKSPYAKGTAYHKDSTKVVYGDAAKVEDMILTEKTKYRSVYFYETEAEMVSQVGIDREFLGDCLDKVEFIEVV